MTRRKWAWICAVVVVAAGVGATLTVLRKRAEEMRQFYLSELDLEKRIVEAADRKDWGTVVTGMEELCARFGPGRHPELDYLLAKGLFALGRISEAAKVQRRYVTHLKAEGKVNYGDLHRLISYLSVLYVKTGSTPFKVEAEELLAECVTKWPREITGKEMTKRDAWFWFGAIERRLRYREDISDEQFRRETEGLDPDELLKQIDEVCDWLSRFIHGSN